MSWWHKIQGKPFLGKFEEDSRRSFQNKDGIWGRQIVSYLIHPNPELDDGKWVKKYLNFLFIGMDGHEARQKCVKIQEDRNSRALLHEVT